MGMTWQRTGSIDPRALVDARLQLHWAAQAAAAVGRTLNAPRADDSHTSFRWSEAHEALLQEPLDGVTCGLRLRDLTLIVFGAQNDAFPLRGRTLDDAFGFAESRFGHPLQRASGDLPDHPVAHGARFDANEEHLAEVARYFASAATILGDARCWPHHFDIATLITLSGPGEELRTLGTGLSPGDAGSDEPYYYVNHWPHPDALRLGMLAIGRWNTIGWTGAVLEASRFAEIEKQEEQEAFVRAFIDEAHRCILDAAALH
jgi:hypothetical protein